MGSVKKSMEENTVRKESARVIAAKRKVLVEAMEKECIQYEGIPSKANNPTPDEAGLMVRAFMAKKRLQEAMDYGKKKVVEVRKEINITAWGRRRGRPRAKTTKLLTMVKEGEIYRLAGRGRPKAGQVRVKLEVGYKFIASTKSWYTYADGKLTEINK